MTSSRETRMRDGSAPIPAQSDDKDPLHADADSSDDDDDPTIAEYDVFITSDISWPEAQSKALADDGTKAELFLLHYPTRPRTQPYNGDDTPLSMRMKPRAGFVEVDVPIHQDFNFDTRKGQDWGKAVNAMGTSGGRGGFGIANGFHNGSMQADRSTRRIPEEEGRMDTDEPRRLNRQTLGGMVETPGKGAPRYLLGTFRGHELHLTPITGLAQLRPELYHIDAANQQNRSSSGRDAGSNPISARTASGAARMLAISHRQTGPGAAAGGDGTGLANTKELLAQAAEEEWSELKYFDEEATESYEAFQAHAFLPDDDRDELVAEWTTEEYLDHIGGTSAPARRAAAVRRTDRRRRGKPTKKARMSEGDKEVAVAISSDEDSSGEDRADVEQK